MEITLAAQVRGPSSDSQQRPCKKLAQWNLPGAPRWGVDVGGPWVLLTSQSSQLLGSWSSKRPSQKLMWKLTAVDTYPDLWFPQAHLGAPLKPLGAPDTILFDPQISWPQSVVGESCYNQITALLGPSKHWLTEWVCAVVRPLVQLQKTHSYRRLTLHLCYAIVWSHQFQKSILTHYYPLILCISIPLFTGSFVSVNINIFHLRNLIK